MSLTPNLPTEEGRALGEQLVRFVDDEAGKFYAEFPDARKRCETCAFRRGTQANGCPGTLMDALKCIHEREYTFYCHEDDHHVCMGAAILSHNITSNSPPVKVPWDFSLTQEQEQISEEFERRLFQSTDSNAQTHTDMERRTE